jgi:hypothetical protein
MKNSDICETKALNADIKEVCNCIESETATATENMRTREEEERARRRN